MLWKCTVERKTALIEVAMQFVREYFDDDREIDTNTYHGTWYRWEYIATFRLVDGTAVYLMRAADGQNGLDVTIYKV
jgi:hypothetical protein